MKKIAFVCALLMVLAAMPVHARDHHHEGRPFIRIDMGGSYYGSTQTMQWSQLQDYNYNTYIARPLYGAEADLARAGRALTSLFRPRPLYDYGYGYVPTYRSGDTSTPEDCIKQARKGVKLDQDHMIAIVAACNGQRVSIGPAPQQPAASVAVAQQATPPPPVQPPVETLPKHEFPPIIYNHTPDCIFVEGKMLNPGEHMVVGTGQFKILPKAGSSDCQQLDQRKLANLIEIICR